MWLEPLLGWIRFDVQNLILNERIRMELLLGMRKEKLRHVGEDVFGAADRQPAQHVGCHSAGAAADLQDPHRATFREAFQCVPDGLLRKHVVYAVCRRVLIEVLGHRGRALWEDELKRIDGATQNLGQLLAAVANERELRQVAGETTPHRLPDLLWIRRFRDAAHYPSIIGVLEHAALRQYFEQPAEDTSLFGDDAELVRQRVRRE